MGRITDIRLVSLGLALVMTCVSCGGTESPGAPVPGGERAPASGVVESPPPPAGPLLETLPRGDDDPPRAKPEDPPSPTVLRITGCGVVHHAFLAELAAIYRERSDLEVSVEPHGESDAIARVLRGDADVAGACRHRLPNPSEAQLLFHPIAWDALVVAVHPMNHAEDISTTDLARALTGRLTNWYDLSGRHTPLHVLTRDDAQSGVERMTRELLFADPDLEFTGSTRSFASGDALERALAADLDAIAVTGVSSARKRALKLLAVDGIRPTQAELRAGRYRLARPLYLVTRDPVEPHVQDFLDYARGDGQRDLATEGCLTLAEGAGLWDGYRERLRRARAGIIR